MSPREHHRFSEAFLRLVLELLDAHPLGCSLQAIIDGTGRQQDSCIKALRIVGEKTWAGSKTAPAQYLRHAEAETRIADHCAGAVSTVAPPPPALNYAVDGMCPGCTCDPKPSQFEMRDGKPSLIGCPRMPSPHRPVAPLLQPQRLLALWEGRRRLLLRALRQAEDPLTIAELVVATRGLLSAEALTDVLRDLEADGTAVRLRRTRAGSGGCAIIAVFALASTLPDPLRAS